MSVVVNERLLCAGLYAARLAVLVHVILTTRRQGLFLLLQFLKWKLTVQRAQALPRPRGQ